MLPQSEAKVWDINETSQPEGYNSVSTDDTYGAAEADCDCGHGVDSGDDACAHIDAERLCGAAVAGSRHCCTPGAAIEAAPTPFEVIT